MTNRMAAVGRPPCRPSGFAASRSRRGARCSLLADLDLLEPGRLRVGPGPLLREAGEIRDRRLPVAYVTVTFASMAAVAPSLGETLITSSASVSGSSSSASLRSTLVKPASSSSCWTSSLLLPTRSPGILPVSGPTLTVMVTVLSSSTTVSATGSWAMTVPLVSSSLPFSFLTVTLSCCASGCSTASFWGSSRRWAPPPSARSAPRASGSGRARTRRDPAPG